MKHFLLLTLLFLSSYSSNDLFDGVKFNEQGVGYKKNIPVIYMSFGKTVNDIVILKKKIKTTTDLYFTYNNKEYYISIEEKIFPQFLYKLKEGDIIYIDIVVFNTKECYPKGKTHKDYCSYINRISKIPLN